jgi:hypothetical protein
MTYAHSILKRSVIIVLACFFIIEIFLFPFDYYRYSQTLYDYGLPGLFTLPSVVVFQISYLVLIAAFFLTAIRAGLLVRFRIVAWVFGLAVVWYCLSLWGIHWSASYGEFGVGGAFFFGVFGFLPSAAFIYFAMPAILLYANRKRCA